MGINEKKKKSLKPVELFSFSFFFFFPQAFLRLIRSLKIYSRPNTGYDYPLKLPVCKRLAASAPNPL